MRAMQAADEFYPNFGCGVLGMLLCVSVGFLAIGLLLACAGLGTLWLGAASLVLGAFSLDAFLSMLRMRVVVGPGGIAKRVRSWLGGFDVPWADITGWSVELSDAEEAPGMRIARFRVRTAVVEVSERCVSATGFEPFLAAVRRHVGGPESPE